MNTVKEHTKEQPNCEYCGGDGIYIDNDSNRLKCPMCKNGKSLTLEQPQSVDNTIDVEERIYPCIKCSKMRTKAEGGTTFSICEDCWDKEQPKAIEDDVWDEELINKFFYYLKYDKAVDTLEDSFMNDFKQHYSLIKK